MPTTNNSDFVALSISGKLHHFSLVHHELSPCQFRIFMKTSNFHLFWIVQFHHRCYSTISCKAASSANVKFEIYWVINDVAQTYRIPSDSLFITTLSIIETHVRASRTYIEIDMMQLVLSHCPWFNACWRISLIVGSLFVCIIGLWMSDPKSPQHLAEQTQSFLSCPLNFSKILTKLRKRFLKKLTSKWAVRNVIFSVAMC